MTGISMKYYRVYKEFKIVLEVPFDTTTQDELHAEYPNSTIMTVIKRVEQDMIEPGCADGVCPVKPYVASSVEDIKPTVAKKTKKTKTTK